MLPPIHEVRAGIGEDENGGLALEKEVAERFARWGRDEMDKSGVSTAVCGIAGNW